MLNVCDTFLLVVVVGFHVDYQNNYDKRQFLASMLLPNDPDEGRLVFIMKIFSFFFNLFLSFLACNKTISYFDEVVTVIQLNAISGRYLSC